jgi:hypothetical protein
MTNVRFPQRPCRLQRAAPEEVGGNHGGEVALLAVHEAL